MKKRVVIEWAPFTIKDEITEATLLNASAALQEEFLQNQAGFLKRELVKKSAKDFVDVVYWESREDAERVIANAENSPVCFAYFQLMLEADTTSPVKVFLTLSSLASMKSGAS